MTRENKLALIVAFALILGVSVLLSDHLSSARTVVPGQVQETTRLPSVPQRPIRTLDDVVREAGMAAAQPESPARGSQGDREGPGAELAQAETGTWIDLDGILDGLDNAPGAVGIDPAPGSNRPVGDVGRHTDEHEPVVIEQRVPERRVPNTPAPGNERPGSGAGGDEPVRSHPVRSGESMFAIAAKYYGDGSLWRELARFNGDRVKADGTVNTGVMLRIPSRQALTGAAEPPAVSPGATTPARNEPRPTTPASSPARPRTYTVASGDTLGEISLATLGTSRRWREIYELNRDRIPDPDRVRAGTVLSLPASSGT